MSMMKDQVTSKHFSKTYTSQAFVVVKEEAVTNEHCICDSLHIVVVNFFVYK